VGRRRILGASTSGDGLKGTGKGRHKQWLHSNPDSKIGSGALNRPRYDHLPVYRSIGEMSVPTQRIGSPLGVGDCDSLAINDIFSLPRSAREGDPNSSYQVLWEDGDRVFCRRRRVGDDGTWSAVLVVLPVAAHPSPSNLDRLAHAYELKGALDGLWAVRPLETLWHSALSGAIERVDQISTNGRLWLGANEPRDVQFTLPAAQEDP
jgi:hypothetical protein